VPTPKRVGFLLLNEVTEIFEFDRQIHVVHHDFVGNMEDNWCEIKNAGDTGIDRFIGDFLGFTGGNGENGHFHAALLDDFGKAFHRIDRSADSFFALAVGFHVESGDDFEAFLFEAFVGKKREAEVADTDENDRLQAGRAEQVGNHFAELLNVVTESASAELAEVSEVFAELSGFDAGGFGEGFAGDGADVVLFETLQATEIDRQAVNCLARNFSSKSFLQPE